MSRADRVSSYLAKGDRLMAEGDPTRAILQYKNALQLDPKSVRVRLSLGRCYCAQQQYPEGYRQFTAALELDPESDEARLETAALLARGNQEQARKALSELARLKKPQDYEPRFSIVKAESCFNLGQIRDALAILSPLRDKEKNLDIQRLLTFCYRKTGDFEKMKKAAQKWQALDPSEALPYIFMARYFHQVKDNRQALRELDAMVKKNTANQADFALLRARTLEQLGMLKEAQAAFEALPREPELLREKADFFLRHGNEENAERILRQIIADKPQDGDAVIQLSRMLGFRRRFDQALELLDTTIALDLPDSDQERMVLEKATLTALQGKLKTAKTICTTVLQGNQSNVDARFLLGKILLKLGEMEQAELHLNQVVVARPELGEAQVLLAQCQLSSRKDSLAEETLRKSLRFNPSDLTVRMELADVYLQRENPQKAIKVLDDGLALKPDEANLLGKRGAIKRAQKDYTGAEKDFNQVIRVLPASFLGYLEMGHLRYMQSRPDEAIDWYKQAMTRKGGLEQALPPLLKVCHEKKELDTMTTLVKTRLHDTPSDPILHYYLGIAFMAQKSWENGEWELLTARRLAPQWSTPCLALAKLYIRQRKPDKALDELKMAYENHPALPVGLQLAALYESRGNWKDGVAVYQDMLERNGDLPVLLNNLAFSYAEYYPDEVRMKEAAQMAARCLALKPENPTYKDTAAWVAYKQGKMDAAWNYIQEALAIAPDEGVCNLHAAIILHTRGETAQALHYLEKAVRCQLDPPARDKAVLLRKEWNKQGKKS
ncbi:MAG: tetratricopeptide repeat protein [bacterium]